MRLAAVEAFRAKKLTKERIAIRNPIGVDSRLLTGRAMGVQAHSRGFSVYLPPNYVSHSEILIAYARSSVKVP